ncbi:hypothetical protein GJ699_01895 [Duganella sp. FT80W]|uniref:Uncharacterized protein n=1 Tax=Duganella guangzhouensis TaxID=2666084 RepID=A0A6I2KSP9_9BURK|nr:hypothetical protein [Duganella guangzhouensis]MRW88733.1 hypothetical protein [Duganella guangzhouensis]
MTSHYADVLIGLSYTFLAVSLLCAATREAIASLFQTRAKVLLDGVLTLLHEPDHKSRLRGILPSLSRLLRRHGGFGLDKLGSASLTAEVMRHPLITGMAQRGRMPSYIPSQIFARAFVSTLTAKYGKGKTAAMLLEQVGNEGLTRTLLAIMGEGPDDVAALEAAVRIWYDTVMERISGWYKRRSQFVLFLVGLFYAVAMNIDALQLSQRLWKDDALRDSMVEKAEQIRAAGLPPPLVQPPDAVASGASSALAQAAVAQAKAKDVQQLPIGWPSSRFDGVDGAWPFVIALAMALVGWVATAFAASLGSPFWFDGIGWLLALRGTGAKPASETAAAPPSVTITLPSLRK